ncbi:hypothetical protein [Vibrio owensii]|uniref:hypothetical protein n=1 Tax=Vibrio harveyi group TaxID=717610 RepID=UPI003CC51766
MSVIALSDNERFATTVEESEYLELMKPLIDRTNELIGCGMYRLTARKRALKELGAKTLREYLHNNNCNVIAVKRPDTPTFYVVDESTTSTTRAA